MDSDMVVHNGGCHCKKVRWKVRAPSSVLIWQCNCSDCSMRGNLSFSVPLERSNPDGIAVTFRCVDPGTITHVEIRQFDGKNWERSYAESGIASYSKVPDKSSE
ncbi:centromere protein V-like isoform X2 [Olea europaea var. sylvestris]|uniref:centromere protein V-like isoform X2 n=1 Tax=Olea europaea var. sylvestris TaxID=158386 RepID=UPI000C1D1371|nr:centromere protein V-like isoform X2 [Olea europaea var. sylvestris]